ncbi:MAG: hypothetical protein JXB19_04955 [Bacteroidales bacterium]|nr:hypothetical protein [Bacteroidales bacterium]
MNILFFAQISYSPDFAIRTNIRGDALSPKASAMAIQFKLQRWQYNSSFSDGNTSGLHASAIYLPPGHMITVLPVSD